MLKNHRGNSVAGLPHRFCSPVRQLPPFSRVQVGVACMENVPFAMLLLNFLEFHSRHNHFLRDRGKRSRFGAESRWRVAYRTVKWIQKDCELCNFLTEHFLHSQLSGCLLFSVEFRRCWCSTTSLIFDLWLTPVSLTFILIFTFICSCNGRQKIVSVTRVLLDEVMRDRSYHSKWDMEWSVWLSWLCKSYVFVNMFS